MPNFRNTLNKYNVFPSGVTSDKELDTFFARKRAILLKKYCEEGKIILSPGAAKFLTALRNRNIKIGIFTSSSHILADSMLSTLLAGEGLNYDELIPKSRRVYGPDIERPKPDPFGWYLATEQLELKPQDVILFDDRMSVAAHAAAATPHFGATIGVYHNDSSTTEWRRSATDRSFGNDSPDGEIIYFHPKTIFGFVKNFSFFRPDDGRDISAN